MKKKRRMNMKMTFALYFGNRSFMPEHLIAGARADMVQVMEECGYDYLIMDEEVTPYGGIETRDDGRLYANWLKSQEGKYDGVILCMPNFSDENGAVTALQDAGVPILIQAYPDELDKMGFEYRRDAYCGKFSIEDVFHQYGIPFTVFKPHVVHPLTDVFKQNLSDFAAVCRVVKGMKRLTIGCFGARTTAFKTVRFDEITLQKYGITVESFDLSSIVFAMENKKDDDPAVQEKIKNLKSYTDFSKVPSKKTIYLAKLAVIMDEYIEKYHLDAITFRCWEELQAYYGIAPCVLLSEMNDRRFVASCEVDLCSSISMQAMQLASNMPTTCVDWNNNYGEDEDKVILFHCGPIAETLMAAPGHVTDHKMFSKNKPDQGWGSNEGRIKSFPMTFSNCKTEDGKLTFYFSEGEFTEDKIQDGFFGCGGVAKIENLQDKLIKLGRNGFRHHTAVGVGNMKMILEEAAKYYLGYDLIDLE
jgi:L-fucose isomerase-like protein